MKHHHLLPYFASSQSVLMRINFYQYFMNLAIAYTDSFYLPTLLRFKFTPPPLFSYLSSFTLSKQADFCVTI